MSTRKLGTIGRRAALLSLLLLSSTPAFAQATRTWVSGVGDDTYPCSRTAPCKTWAGAISKTAAGGEINALDSGGFGTLTITKSLTIDGAAAHASTLNAGGVNGFYVNAPADAIVTIRNVAINGSGTTPGSSGIRFNAGGVLNVENVFIQKNSLWGIRFEPTGASELNVVNTTIAHNLGASGGGILVKPGALGTANATLSDVHLLNNILGLRVEARSTVALVDSTVGGSTNVGVLAFAPSGTATVAVNGSRISGNGVGLRSQGATAEMAISGNSVTGNGTGLSSLDAGVLGSFGNNYVRGNGTDGQPTVDFTAR
jgi:hypothetical protein